MPRMSLTNWRRNTLDKYTVKFYKRAIRDIDGIYAYIALEKLSPENAKSQADRIKEAIFDLETMPQSHQDRLVFTRFLISSHAVTKGAHLFKIAYAKIFSPINAIVFSTALLVKSLSSNVMFIFIPPQAQSMRI